MDNKTTLNEVINLYISRALENVHTMLIGRVEAVNTSTIDVQPVTKKVLNGSAITMPLFKDVIPMVFQGGGSYEIYPIAVGDYCMLFIAEDNTENWYNGRDNAEPNEERRFDYSDCFAFVGINPLSAAKTIPANTLMSGNRDMRNGVHAYDGTADIEIDGISLREFINDHTHSGVESGPSNTGVPNPL